MQRYRKHYKYILTKLNTHTEIPSNIICNEDKCIELDNMKTKVSNSKKTPNESPSNYDVDYIIKSTNDNREYTVKLIKGRGGVLHKRWILVKS